MSADGTKLFGGAGVYAGRDTAGPIYASGDSGLTWNQIADSRFWRGLACSGDGSTVLASSDLVFVSHDYGVTWQQTSMPSGTWRGATMSSDGNKMAVVNYSGFWRDPSTMWTSVDSGASWKPMSSIRSLVLVSSGDGSRIFANGDNALQPPDMSADWGATWKSANLSTVGCAATTYDGNKWFAGSIYGILSSGDSGATWGGSDDPTVGPRSIASIACSSDAGSVYVVDGDGSMFIWQQASAQLSINMETEGAVVSWPSYHLSSRLQENSNLRPNGWIDVNEQPTLTNRIFRFTPTSKIDKSFYRLKTQ
jgi:hypothetical protein